MNKAKIKVLVEMLKVQLNETDKMWNERESHAMIVGYLQGTVKSTITYLEDEVK
jgi:hypothetical protein